MSYHTKGKCLLVSVPPLSAPFASSLSFSPYDGSSKVMKELNKPWEELNVPQQLGRGRGCQGLQDNHPLAFTWVELQENVL